MLVKELLFNPHCEEYAVREQRLAERENDPTLEGKHTHRFTNPSSTKGSWNCTVCGGRTSQRCECGAGVCLPKGKCDCFAVHMLTCIETNTWDELKHTAEHIVKYYADW
jgi:hypothetical protein